MDNNNSEGTWKIIGLRQSDIGGAVYGNRLQSVGGTSYMHDKDRTREAINRGGILATALRVAGPQRASGS